MCRLLLLSLLGLMLGPAETGGRVVPRLQGAADDAGSIATRLQRRDGSGEEEESGSGISETSTTTTSTSSTISTTTTTTPTTTTTTASSTTTTSFSSTTTTISSTTTTISSTTTTVISCAPLEAPAEGSISGDCSGLLGSVCTGSCRMGYVVGSGTSVRTCTKYGDDGRYSGGNVNCRPVNCGTLEAPEHGSIVGSCDGGFADICAFEGCDEGYEPSQEGDLARACMPTELYAGVFPTCDDVEACTHFPCSQYADACDEVDGGANSTAGRSCRPCVEGYSGTGDICIEESALTAITPAGKLVAAHQPITMKATFSVAQLPEIPRPAEEGSGDGLGEGEVELELEHQISVVITVPFSVRQVQTTIKEGIWSAAGMPSSEITTTNSENGVGNGAEQQTTTVIKMWLDRPDATQYAKDNADVTADTVEVSLTFQLADAEDTVAGAVLEVSMASAYVLLVPGYAEGLLQEFQDTAVVEFTVHEPALAFQKMVLNPGLSVPPPEMDAGDAILFRVKATNNLGSAATAYNVLIRVDLDNTLQAPPSSFPAALCKQSCDGFTGTYDSNSNTIEFYTLSVAAGKNFVVDWTNTVLGTVAPNDNVYSVGASVVHYDGAAEVADGRQGALPRSLPSNFVVVGKISAAELTFAFSATSVDATVGLNVTVHEQVEFAATITLPEGQTDVTLVFEIPTALDQSGALLVEDIQVVPLTFGAGIVAESVVISNLALDVDEEDGSATATVSLGTVVNVPGGQDASVAADSVTVALLYRVRDSAEVQHGTRILMGSAELVVPQSDPVVAALQLPAAYAGGDPELIVTLPSLNLTHSQVPGQVGPDTGDMVQFTATVEHSSVTENWSTCRDQWTLVFRQAAGTYRTKELWKSANVNNPKHTEAYSILSDLESFRRNTGEFEFKLVWPKHSGGSKHNHWSQTSNPITRAPQAGVDGYKAIDVYKSSENWGGLEYDTGRSALLDGSVGSSWWYAVGTTTAFTGGIPGPGSVQQEVELYVLECVTSEPPDATAFDLVATAVPHPSIGVDLNTVTCTPACNNIYIDGETNNLIMELDELAPGEVWELAWRGQLQDGTKTGHWTVKGLELAYDSADTQGGSTSFPGRLFDKDVDEGLRKTTSITRKHPKVNIVAKDSSVGLTSLKHATPGEAIMFEVVVAFPESVEDYAVVVDFREVQDNLNVPEGPHHYEAISGTMTGYTDLTVDEHVYVNMQSTITENNRVVTFALGSMQNTNVTEDATQYATMTFEVLAMLKTERNIGNDRTPNSCPNVRGRVEYDVGESRFYLSQKKDICLTVVEPVLSARDDPHLLDAGDFEMFGFVLEHNLAVSNGANAAYELTVTQLFNNQLVLDQSTLFACLYDGNAVSPIADLTAELCTSRGGSVVDTQYTESGTKDTSGVLSVGGNVTLFITSLGKDQKLHLVAGATMVAELEPGDFFENSVTATFQSTPDGAPDMIVGSGTMPVIEYTHNNARHYSSFFDEFPIDVTPPTVLVSLEPATSTDAVTPDPEMTIGEEGIILVESIIPEGVTSLWISLVVPPGIEIVDEDVRWVGATFTDPKVKVTSLGDPERRATPAEIAGKDPSVVFCNDGDYDFCFGNATFAGLSGFWMYNDESTGETVLILNQGVIANVPNNVENEDDKITFEARIRITDIASNHGTGGGTVRTLAANLLYAHHSRSVQHSIDITVVEPALETVVAQINPVGRVDGRDTVTLTATVSHVGASRAPAYDGTTTINVPAELILQPGTITVSSPDNCKTQVTFFEVGGLIPLVAVEDDEDEKAPPTTSTTTTTTDQPDGETTTTEAPASVTPGDSEDDGGGVFCYNSLCKCPGSEEFKAQPWCATENGEGGFGTEAYSVCQSTEKNCGACDGVWCSGGSGDKVEAEDKVHGILVSNLVGVQKFTVSWTNLDTAVDQLVVTYAGIVIDMIRPNQVVPQPAMTEYATMHQDDVRQDADARFYVGAAGLYTWALGTCDVTMHIPTIAIQLLSTSLADTLANTVAVAETTIHEVTLWLPESETQFNSGLLYSWGVGCRNVTVTAVGASIVNSTLSVGDRIPCTNEGQANPRGGTALDFGVVWNIPDNVDDAGDMITFEVEGQTLPSAVTTIIDQRNRGIVADFSAANAEASSTGTAGSSITIAEPLMSATATLVVENDAVYDAGDVVSFDLHIQHTDNRKASSFDLQIDAVVGGHLEIIGVASAVGSTALAEADWVVSNDLTTVSWNVSELLRPDAFTATVTARLLITLPPQYHDATGALCTVDVQYDSYPLSMPAATPVGVEAVLPETVGRVYTASGTSAKVLIDTVSVELVVGESSVFTTTGSELVVEEVVKLEAVVTVPEGTTKLAVSFANLPLALVPIEAVVDAIDGSADGGLVCEHADGNAEIDGTVVRFDFGKCVNVPTGTQDALDTITLHIRAAVKDVPSTVVAFSNWYTQQGVTVSYKIDFVDEDEEEDSESESNTNTRTTHDALGVTILEPALSAEVLLDASRQPATDAGDQVDFQMTVGPTPASSGTAYETVVTVTLGDYLAINAGAFGNNVVPVISEDKSTAVWTLGVVHPSVNMVVTVPSGKIPLVEIGKNPTSLLTRCQGDCDSDEHCAGTLVCYHRGVGEPGPPGCSGSARDGKDGYDYCWDENADTLGTSGFNTDYGAQCECPDGSQYFVGTYGTEACATPACFGPGAVLSEGCGSTEGAVAPLVDNAVRCASVDDLATASSVPFELNFTAYVKASMPSGAIDVEATVDVTYRSVPATHWPVTEALSLLGRAYTATSTTSVVAVAAVEPWQVAVSSTTDILTTSDALPNLAVAIGEQFTFVATLTVPEVTVAIDSISVSGPTPSSNTVIRLVEFKVEHGANILGCNAEDNERNGFRIHDNTFAPDSREAAYTSGDVGECRNSGANAALLAEAPDLDHVLDGNDTITLTVTGQLMDVATVVMHGEKFPFDIAVSLSNGALDTFVSLDFQAIVNAVEPSVDVSLADPTDQHLEPGDEIEWSFNITHSFGHKVAVLVALPALVTHVNTVFATNYAAEQGEVGSKPPHVIAYNAKDHTVLITFPTLFSAAGDGVLTFEVSGRIKETAPPGAELDCSVAIAYQSAPEATNGLADTVRIVTDTPVPFPTVYVSHFVCDARVRSTSEPSTVNPVVAVGEGVVLEWDCTLRGGGPLVLRWNTTNGDANIYPGVGAVAVASSIGSHVTIDGSSAETTVSISLESEDASTGFKVWTAVFPNVINTHIEALSETGEDSLTLTVGLSAVGRDLPPLGTDPAELPTLASSQAAPVETGFALGFADHGSPFTPNFVAHVPVLALTANVTTTEAVLEAGGEVTFTITVESDASNNAIAARNVRVQVPNRFYTNMNVVAATLHQADSSDYYGADEAPLVYIAEGVLDEDYFGYLVPVLEPGDNFTLTITATATSMVPHGPGRLEHFVLATFDTLSTTSTSVTSRFAAKHSPALTVVDLDAITCDLSVELLVGGQDSGNKNGKYPVVATVGEIVKLTVDVALPAGRSENVTVNYYLPKSAIGFVKNANSAPELAVVGLPAAANVFGAFVAHTAGTFVSLSNTEVRLFQPTAEGGAASDVVQLQVVFGQVRYAPKTKNNFVQGSLEVSVFAAFTAAGAGTVGNDFDLSAALERDGYAAIGSPTRNMVVSEPVLQHAVTTTAALADAGDVVSFVHSVTHMAASTDVAKDVTVQVEIHPFFSISACDFASSFDGDVVYSGQCNIQPAVNGKGSLVTAVMTTFPVGEVLTLLIDASMQSTTQPGVDVTPNATLASYRSDGAVSLARVYPSTSTSVQMDTRSPIVETFEVTGASAKLTRRREGNIESVWPGAFVDLSVAVSIPEGTVDDFAVCVELPSEVALVGSTLVQQPNSAVGQGLVTLGDTCDSTEATSQGGGGGTGTGTGKTNSVDEVVAAASHAVWIRFPSRIVVLEASNQTAINKARIAFTASAIVTRGPAGRGGGGGGRAQRAVGSLSSVRTVVVTKFTRYSEVAERELHVEEPKLELSFETILSNTTQENTNTSYRIVTMPFTIVHADDSMVPADLWSITPTFNTTLGNYTLSLDTTEGSIDSLRAMGGYVSGVVTALVHYPGDGPVCFGMDVEYSSLNASNSVLDTATSSGATVQVEPLQHSELVNCSTMVRNYVGAEAKDKGLSGGSIAGLIFLALAVAMFVVLAVMYQHKNNMQDEVDEKDALSSKDDNTFNPAFASQATPVPKGDMGAVLLGTAPPSVLQQKGDRLWSDFRRCVSFDTMYFGNDLLKLDDDMLVKVYQLLTLKCPGRKLFKPLRGVGEKFRKQVLPTTDAAADEGTFVDVVDFIDCALADVLVERAIDLSTLLMARAQAAGKEGANDVEIEEATYAFINDDPAANTFLKDSETGYGKIINPYAAILDEPDYADPEYYNLDDDEEALYAFATGGGGGGDPIYAMGSGNGGIGNDPIYAMGNNNTASSDENPNYSLATVSGNGSSMLDPVYALGSNTADTGPIYSLGNMGTNDPVYSMGNMDNAGVAESNVDALYAMATSSDATYSMASVRNVPRGASEVNNAQAIYEMASEEAQAILDGVANYDIAMPLSPSNDNDTYATATADEFGGGAYATVARDADAGDGHYATTSVFDMDRSRGSLRRASIDPNAAYAVANAFDNTNDHNNNDNDEPVHSNFGRGLPAFGSSRTGSIRSRTGSSGSSLRKSSQTGSSMARALSIAPVTAAQRRRHEHRLKSESNDASLNQKHRRPSGAAETFQFVTMKRSPKKKGSQLLRTINSISDADDDVNVNVSVADRPANSTLTRGGGGGGGSLRRASVKSNATARSPGEGDRRSSVHSNNTAWSPEASEDQTDPEAVEDFPLGGARMSQRRTSNFSVHSFAEV